MYKEHFELWLDLGGKKILFHSDCIDRFWLLIQIEQSSSDEKSVSETMALILEKHLVLFI